MTSAQPNTRELLGYRVWCHDIQALKTDVEDALSCRSGSPRALACLNPHSWAVAQSDCTFAEALHTSEWLIPDGIGVVLASRFLGQRIQQRITGHDVFDLVLEHAEDHHLRVFLFGSTEDVLMRIQNRLSSDYPGLVLAGAYSPPFSPVFTDAEVDGFCDVINATGADVVFVALTAPKQEKLVARMKPRIDAGFIASIGAVFDFYAGTVKRSHPAFQAVGLEWLPRLIQQPKRLWRRMLISAPRFVWAVLMEKLRLGSSGPL